LKGLSTEDFLVYQCISQAGNKGEPSSHPGNAFCKSHAYPSPVLSWNFEQESIDNTGIWTKELKIKTNLQQPQITKILKNLDQRSLVKSVKSVLNPSRKVYMLFELDPARELTGGAW